MVNLNLIHKQEGLCRNTIDKITGKQFHSCWLSFLNDLQQDGYNEEFKLAFEYHGKQHYMSIKFYGGEIFKSNNIILNVAHIQ